MEQQNFENMVQVLGYFAEQCDLFKPMLDGVYALKTENVQLKEKVKSTNIVHNRLQLNSAFSADYANFGIATVKSTTPNPEGDNLKISHEEDLYNLIKAVIKVGKDNYVRADMEYKLDFYSMVGRITDDQYLELYQMVVNQHKVPAETLQPTTPAPEPQVHENPIKNPDTVVNKDLTDKNHQEQPTDILS